MKQATPSENASRSPANGRRRRLPRKVLRCVQWIVNAAVLVVAIMALTPAGDLPERWLIVTDPLAKADCIIVLGGGGERAVEAAQLYREGWARRVIFSSAGPDADWLAGIARSCGLPEEAVVLDPGATRTADHPRSIAALGEFDRQTHSFIIVTSPFHSSRAKACFEKAGYRHIRVRTPRWTTRGDFDRGYRDWATRMRNLPLEFREAAAWVYYGLRGWV
jgi:uncharacterized SAM-binding protein YcdF (DUF218 family)